MENRFPLQLKLIIFRQTFYSLRSYLNMKTCILLSPLPFARFRKFLVLTQFDSFQIVKRR